MEEYDSTGAMVARYIQGPGIDMPLAKLYAGSWYYYHFDGLGSVTMLTDASKNVRNKYVYDDFGGFRSKTEAIPNSYGFTGRETDVLGTVFMRARYYDTDTGRFLSRDPAGMIEGPNAYWYSENNPMSGKDPAGSVEISSTQVTSTTCSTSLPWLPWVWIKLAITRACRLRGQCGSLAAG